MRRAGSLLWVAALLAACSSSHTAAPSTTTTKRSTADALLAVHATRGAHPAIVDALGRQVILRGVNLNSLGDYYQANTSLPTVVPVTERDWSDMARHGLDVVRLLVSWSSIEPKRGVFDDVYLRRVHDTVQAAAAHGIYSVIDMHQDAWGKYIASPAGTTCPADRQVAIGWDGAPDWATITDGASTCIQGSRENSEAVLNAWDNFYANRDGIRDELVKTWEHVVSAVHGPAVAGFDLLNEPNHGHDSTKALAGLGAYYSEAIAAIRATETRLGTDHHVVFFEDTVFGGIVAPTFTNDTNIVFAPHNYGESIGNIPIEGEFDFFASAAARYETAMWIGEYGWFSDPAAQAPKLARYAAKEDRLITAGDAWWQWRQACGDPHSVGRPGGTPDAHLVHFRANGCPGDHDGGVIPQWACVWRPYPRAVPGRLTALHSNCRDELTFSGTSDAAGMLDVWFPDHGGGAPHVSGSQINVVGVRRVSGGWRIAARVNGNYSVRVSSA